MKPINCILALSTLAAVASAQSMTNSTSKCDECLLVIKYLDASASSAITKEVVEKALGVLCEDVPGYLVSVCKQAVVGITPEIISLIVKYGVTDKICYWIKLCS